MKNTVADATTTSDGYININTPHRAVFARTATFFAAPQPLDPLVKGDSPIRGNVRCGRMWASAPTRCL